MCAYSSLVSTLVYLVWLGQICFCNVNDYYNGRVVVGWKKIHALDVFRNLLWNRVTYFLAGGNFISLDFILC